MFNKSAHKKNLFDLYEEIYNSKEKIGNLKLCANCCSAPCENGHEQDIAVLLPFEDQFILNKLDAKGFKYNPLMVKNIETVYCPFLKNGECSIHSFRPIDCRSYPLIPVFSKDLFVMKLLTRCPYRDNISKNFLNSISITWTKLLPFLPPKWRQKYNKIQSNFPIKDLPNYLQQPSNKPLSY